MTLNYNFDDTQLQIFLMTHIYTDTNPITLPCSLARVGNNAVSIVCIFLSKLLKVPSF